MDIAKPKPSPAQRRRRRYVYAGGAATLVFAAIALTRLGSAAPTVPREGLWLDTARHGDMLREIRASGTLVPEQVRWITAGTGAVTQDVLVKAGAKVDADTVILRLANPAVLANLEKARAALAGAEADVAARESELAAALLDQRATLAKAESTYTISEMNAEAQERAAVAGVVSRLEANQSRISARQNQKLVEIERSRLASFDRNLDAQMRAVRARRDEAASALEIARQEAASLDVRAGIAGILQQVSVEPGQQVQAGATLARVARADALIARLQVPEALAKDLRLDLNVLVDTRDGQVAGRISRIDPSVTNGKVVVDVAFTAALPPGARPDLSVDGRILLSRLTGVTSIGRPPSAAAGGEGSLFVIASGSDQARRRHVVYGAASSDRIEVREGLKAGETVILSDTGEWDDYDALRVR